MDKIGKYQVIRKLGEGATSAVYLCQDPFNNRQVAVKKVQDRKSTRLNSSHRL